MSETLEVPIMGLGTAQTQAWTQALLAAAGMLRERRLAQGRLAWSTGEHAARLHDRAVRAADPAVRVMTDAERSEFDAVVAGGAGQTQTSTRGPDAVTVVVAPLAPGPAWGV